jgi:hypothetical protein
VPTTAARTHASVRRSSWLQLALLDIFSRLFFAPFSVVKYVLRQLRGAAVPTYPCRSTGYVRRCAVSAGAGHYMHRHVPAGARKWRANQPLTACASSACMQTKHLLPDSVREWGAWPPLLHRSLDDTGLRARRRMRVQPAPAASARQKSIATLVRPTVRDSLSACRCSFATAWHLAALRIAVDSSLQKRGGKWIVHRQGKDEICAFHHYTKGTPKSRAWTMHGDMV